MEKGNQMETESADSIKVIVCPNNRDAKPISYIKHEVGGNNRERRYLRYMFESGQSIGSNLSSKMLTEAMEEERSLRKQEATIIPKEEFIKLLVPPFSRTFSFGESPQAMAFDVDNWTTKSKVNEILQKHNIEAFCYDTFSYGQTRSKEMIKPSFRVIIFFDKPITDVALHTKLYKHLAQLLHANEANCSMDMYFYGGLKWEVQEEIQRCTHLKNYAPKTCAVDKLIERLGLIETEVSCAS